MATDREIHERRLAAGSSTVPVALQYLYGGSNVVQGESFQIKQVPTTIVEVGIENAANYILKLFWWNFKNGT